jgi:hypothetical protein
MAINFPSSPTEGLIFNASPGISFIFRSGVWVPAPLKTALPKNYFVNPAMQISQQNVNTLVSGLTAGASAYPADQWLLLISCDPGAASTQRIQAVTPFGSADRIRSTVTVGTNVSSLQGDYLFQQRIEGNRVADLRFGTTSAKQIILRFGWKSPAGTYTVLIRNAQPTATRTYLAAFTITAGQANTDTLQTFIIPGDTTGTWANDASLGLTVAVQMGGGGPFGNNGNAGWNAGNRSYILGQTTGTKTAGLAYDLFDCGLYADPYMTGVAPPWELPDSANELRRCQRYWYRGFGLDGGVVNATVCSRISNRHPVPMRATPAASIVGTPRMYDYGVTPVITGLTSVSNEYAAEFDATCSAGGLTAGRAVSNYWQDENQYIAMSARI